MKLFKKYTKKEVQEALIKEAWCGGCKNLEKIKRDNYNSGWKCPYWSVFRDNDGVWFCIKRSFGVGCPDKKTIPIVWGNKERKIVL